MGKVIFDSLGFVLREADTGPICSTKQLPNVRWLSDGVPKYACLVTSETKKFPKGHTPDKWMAHMTAEVLSVVKYYDDGPKTKAECDDFAKSVWEAWSHESHNVHMSSRCQPMTAHCQIMLFLPGGLIVRGRQRPNDESTYRNNFIGLNCMTPWGRYEMIVYSIIDDVMGGDWPLTVPAFVAACKSILDTHYPFLSGMFDNCVPAQWPWTKSLFWQSLTSPSVFLTEPVGLTRIERNYSGTPQMLELKRQLEVMVKRGFTTGLFSNAANSGRLFEVGYGDLDVELKAAIAAHIESLSPDDVHHLKLKAALAEGDINLQLAPQAVMGDFNEVTFEFAITVADLVKES